MCLDRTRREAAAAPGAAAPPLPPPGAALGVAPPCRYPPPPPAVGWSRCGGETHQGLFLPLAIHLQMCHPAPPLLGKDCRGIFKMTFSNASLPPPAFYISLLEITNRNLFPPSDFLFLPPPTLCFLPYIASTFDGCLLKAPVN